MFKRRATSPPANAPSILLGGGHLVGLWALAVLQPLLNLLGSNPDFFVARDNTGGQIVVFVLLAAFLPPAVATAVEALVALFSRRARWGLHLALVALLFAAIVLQFLKQLADGPGIPMILVALAAGGLLTWAYRQRGFIRSLTDILIPAPLVVLVVFIFFSSASELITSSAEATAIKADIGNPAPVVMVVFDEFPVGSLLTPDGEINRKRFPNFAELESRSDWYRNAVTNASYTAIAVPSILTGKPVDHNLLPTANDHPESVFTLLGGSYRVRAVEPITQLCPPSICPADESEKKSTRTALEDLFSDLRYVSAHLTLPESMGSSLPDISQSFAGFGATAPDDSLEPGRARQWVADKLHNQGTALDGEGDLNEFFSTMSPKTKHTFDFVHVTEPHYPWTHYPSGHSYSRTTEDFRNFITETDWTAGPYLTSRARQAHVLETGYTDYLLGRVISRLKRDGRWDDSLVVVVADHGGAMTKNSNRRQAESNTIGEIATVPLFVKAPGQKTGKIVDRPTCVSETLDLMAAALDTTVPWGAPDCDRDEGVIDNGPGSLIRVPMATVLKQRAAYVNTLADLFGGDTGWSSVLKLGPNQDLIGRAVASVPTGTLSPGQTVSPEKPVSDYQPRAPLTPILRQRGALKGFPDAAPLAIAVNGRIAAVGESYRDQSKNQYSILLPQTAIKRGQNLVAVYAVGGTPGHSTLSQLWSSSDQ